MYFLSFLNAKYKKFWYYLSKEFFNGVIDLDKNKIIKIIEVCAIFILIIISVLMGIGVINTSYSSTMLLGTLFIFTFLKYFELKGSSKDKGVKLYKRGAYFFGLATIISFILIGGVNNIINL